jgi:hypothetical protein
MAVVSRRRPNLELAKCLAGDGVGASVYVSGDRVGGFLQVATADPSDRLKMPAVGMIIQKVDSTTCVVQTEGNVDGVYSGLTPGELLFVGDGGGLDDEMPSPGPGPRYVQAIGVSLGSDILRLEPNIMMTRRRA